MKPLKIKKEAIKKILSDKTNYSKNAFSLDVGKINWRSFYLSENPEIMYKHFCSSLETVIKKHAPQKTVFIRHDKPKLTLHQQWISKNTVKNFAKTSNNNKNVLKQENEKHLLDVFQNLKNARERWNFINEIRNCEKIQTEIPRLKNSFRTVLTNGNDIANLNYKFSALGEYFVKKEQYQFRNNPARHSNKFIFRYTTTKEIFDILNNLNVKKPCGPSLIPAWALKDAREYLAEPLCFLFNQFLTEQLFPDDLKRAHELPLFMKDDPQDPINYRPILLTGALTKIFGILFRDQILAYLEKNKLLATTQFGYRKKCQLQMLLYIALKKSDMISLKQNIVTGAFLDLSKAFDSISHPTLLH